MPDEEFIHLPPPEGEGPAPIFIPPAPVQPAKQVQAPPKTPVRRPPTQPEVSPQGGGGKGGGGLPGIVVFALILLALAFTALLNALANLANDLLRLIWGRVAPGRTPPQVTPHQVGQRVTNALGTAAANADPEVGGDLTQLAATVTWVGRAILALEVRLHRLALQLAPLAGATKSLTGRAAALEAGAAQAKRLQQQQQQAQTIKDEQAAKRATGLEARLAGLEQYRAKVIEPELERLRSQIPELQRGHVVTQKEIEQHNELLGLTGFTTLTAAALARLGANWIRCQATQELGRGICRQGPDLSSALLAGLLDAMLIADACNLVKAVANGATDAAPVLGLVSDGLTELLECLSVERPPALAYSVYAPPPLQANAAWPSNIAA